MSFSRQEGEFDRFFNRLDRPVEESRPDRQPHRCRLTRPVSISDQHSHSILHWCHQGGDLMYGAITGEPGFLIEGGRITCNDVFKHF